MASRGEDERAEHVEDDDGGVLLVFVAGVVMGAIEYSQRSSVVEPHQQGANAIPAHLVLAGVAVVLFIGLPRLRWARRAPSSIWVAPFSQSGLDRLKLSIRPSSRSSPMAVGRAILVVVLTIAFLYKLPPSRRASHRRSRSEFHRQRMGSAGLLRCDVRALP
jgi:hypothetical protein